MEVTGRQFLALGALVLLTVAGLDGRRFDLILAGHSHGTGAHSALRTGCGSLGVRPHDLGFYQVTLVTI